MQWISRRFRAALVIAPGTASVARPGGYLGTMPEVRVRHDAIPGNLTLEAGAAYLFKGRFAEDAPGSPDEGDSPYVSVQTILTF